MTFVTPLIYIALPLTLLTLGLIVGGANERRHFRRLEEREHDARNFRVSQIKTFPDAAKVADLAPTLIVAEVVIGSDYLKSFLANLRNIFGGEVRSFQTLLTRSRREALMRLVEQARDQGFNALCNVRFDTADVGGASGKVHMSAVLASGTAYRTDEPQ